jgi:hypothetical protein
MRRETLALPLVLALGVSTKALAQAAPGASPPAETSSRDVNFGFGLVAEHHTNSVQTSKASALARGLEPEDWIARPTVRIDAVQPVGRNALYVNGSAGYAFHRNNAQLDSNFYDVSGGGVANLSFCVANVFGGYKRFRSEVGDLVGAVTNNIETRRSIGATVQCGRESGLTAVATVGRQWRTNSAKVIQESNGDTDSATLAMGYANYSLGSLQLVGSYSESSYPNRVTSLLPTPKFGDTVFIRTLGVSYTKDIGPKLNLQAQASRTFVKRSSAPVGIKPKFESNTYSGAVTYKVSPRLDLAISGSRAITPSTQIGKLYDKATNSAVVIHYKVGTRLNLTLGAQRIDSTSNTDGTLSSLTFTKSRRDSVYGSIRYTRAKLGSLGLELRQTERDTDFAPYDFSDTLLALTLDASF